MVAEYLRDGVAVDRRLTLGRLIELREPALGRDIDRGVELLTDGRVIFDERVGDRRTVADRGDDR